jgi:transcriptional regulator with XRE-family HTH domain
MQRHQSPGPFEPDIGMRIGSTIKVTRQSIGWTERELADRLGTNQGAIQRLEGGAQVHLNVRLATAALDTLGIRVTIDANPMGLSDRREQRDSVHARCCGFVARQLQMRGWEVRLEVEIGEGRTRGWIDILAFRRSDRALLVIEVKTEINDVGRLLRSLGWYARSCREAAQSVGWRPRLVVPALIGLATEEVDARLIANADLIRNALPDNADRLAAWMDDASAEAPRPAVGLIDPLSRRRAWLRRTRGDRRRAPPPYRDYRDAALHISTGRRSDRRG